MGINIKNITGIDMDNVANLQNHFFKNAKMSHICHSYGPDHIVDNVDYVYSNCCLAELTVDTNYFYYNNYLSKCKGFYIVWCLIYAELPEYYKEFTACNNLQNIINMGLPYNTNCLIIKL